MCGASSQQEQLASEESAFYAQGMQESATVFAEDQALNAAMNAVYEPILAKGPNQTGFSEAELNSLNAQAVEGTAQNYQQAGKAVNEQMAAEGGGNISLPTGAQTQAKEEVASAAAGQESSEESQITQANYAQGYSEFQGATAAMEAESGQLSPASYENAASNAGSVANSEANAIQAANNSWINAAIGAVGSIGGAALV